MRYKNQSVFVNDNEPYKKFLKNRGIKSIKQYETPKLRYPTDLQARTNFSTKKHIWSTGDRYFKLAEEYYGDPTMWWAIAFYNQKPTEFHLNLGDVLFIPMPLESFLYTIGY